ncbi:hypothetical protein G210_5981 [Candida maltosa Xu316]|uniref:Endonuclease/exonuclease/phosphatase domain-containing protein n=1 Tax=Candida maltosa (strain Xu316) TaxID=1245528 RepID=M3K8F2_CANMX|nr:hypothetical protein G210_5981 [Candida maltosa Xu316]
MFSIQTCLFLFGVFTAFSFASPVVQRSQSAHASIKIFNNNIRQDAKNPFAHELPWSERKVGLLDALTAELGSKHEPVLISIQEVLHNQLEDVLNGLNKYDSKANWVHFGVGRDDGKTKGEYSPVIYNANEWELIAGSYQWLSPTPNVPSKFPGAGTIRIVTVTTLKHKDSRVIINFLNTHFDHISEDARRAGAEQILNIINSLPNNYPTFVAGDFNSPPTAAAYLTLASQLADARDIAKKTVNANLKTFTGFEPEDEHNDIDFIFTKLPTTHDTKIDIKKLSVVDTIFKNGSRFSDHRPVVANIKIKV